MSAAISATRGGGRDGRRRISLRRRRQSAGPLDFFQPYDPFRGTGSYFAGLQAGYNVVLPNRLLLGIEADVSFPE